MLLAAPLARAVHLLGSGPPKRRRSAGSLPGQIVQAQDQTVNCDGEATEEKNVPPWPTSKRRNKRTSSVKIKNWTEPERKLG